MPTYFKFISLSLSSSYINQTEGHIEKFRFFLPGTMQKEKISCYYCETSCWHSRQSLSFFLNIYLSHLQDFRFSFSCSLKLLQRWLTSLWKFCLPFACLFMCYIFPKLLDIFIQEEPREIICVSWLSVNCSINSRRYENNSVL